MLEQHANKDWSSSGQVYISVRVLGTRKIVCIRMSVDNARYMLLRRLWPRESTFVSRTEENHVFGITKEGTMWWRCSTQQEIVVGKYQATAVVYGRPLRDNCAQSGARCDVLYGPKIPPPERDVSSDHLCRYMEVDRVCP